jgi:hypothetical protein
VAGGAGGAAGRAIVASYVGWESGHTPTSVQGAVTSDWTPNGISTADQTTDIPTNNFATLNSVFRNSDATYGTVGSIVSGNLELSSVGSVTNAYSTFALPASGKYYAEVRVSSLNAASIGIMANDGNVNRSILFDNTGVIKNNNATSQSSLGAWTSGDTIGMAFDMDAGTLQFYRQGSPKGTPEPIATSYSQPYLLFGRVNAYLEWNFGQRPFTFSVPSGYKTLSTANLPSATIANPKQYFDVRLRTGTAANYALTGLGFQPDFLWTKIRSSADNSMLFDSVRGTGNCLVSNLTQAETNFPTSLTSFNSDGYSGGNLVGAWNSNGSTYVDWLWKAGGAAVTNNSGSIASQVSANPTAGFSIVTYTGAGANGTIGHGLGVQPKFILLKGRNTTSASAWAVASDYGSFNWNTDYFQFDTVAKRTDAAGTVFRQAPDTNVFSLGNNTGINESGKNFVAYAWSEVPGFSKFGSYAGNGSSDGAFVYTGFKPRYVMVKRTNASDDWYIVDAARSPNNMSTYFLMGDSTASESAGLSMDIVSNGFKLRDTSTGTNASGGIYIYAAFADQPFGGSNVAPATAK